MWRPCSRQNEAAWRSCVVGGVTGVFRTGRRFGNRALAAPLKAWQRRLLSLPTAHCHRHLPAEDLAHPNPPSLQSSRCNPPPLRVMAPRRAVGAARSSKAVPWPAAPLLDSRIKSSRELQTVREMVGSKNNEWGTTRI
jgi:hypothetical protein